MVDAIRPGSTDQPTKQNKSNTTTLLHDTCFDKHNLILRASISCGKVRRSISDTDRCRYGNTQTQ